MIDISGIAVGWGNGEVPHVALSKGQQMGGKMSILNEEVSFFAPKFLNN
jgi:hypothetical protein